ncbi:MAG: response regulator [Phycisphaerae bacterium]|jgi:CheY-like chemotaxis protein|nr:response regulator [Phycisphaerae bacterium]
MFPDASVGTYTRTNYTMTDPTKSQTEAQDRRDRHILMVDDEVAILRMTKRILTVKGYDVTTCASGAEAVEVYSKLHDKIDLVILDMIMPKMNGAETLIQLKQIDPTVRVVLCSAFIPDLKGHTVAAEGFVGFLSKPFQVNALLAIINLHVK